MGPFNGPAIMGLGKSDSGFVRSIGYVGASDRTILFRPALSFLLLLRELQFFSKYFESPFGLLYLFMVDKFD